MQDLSSLNSKIASMSRIALKMWQLTHQAFMEDNIDLFTVVLKEENKLNDMEKEIAASLIDLIRHTSFNDEKAKISIYVDIVGDLELIGDYCKDILERVQVKIEEKLLFSDDGVSDYDELYHKTETALKEVVNALDKDNPASLKEVLENALHIENTVDEYRKRHTQRLLNGVCSPFTSNMFLNMLDFTASVYSHTTKIARNLLNTR